MNRDELPKPPSTEERKKMAVAFIESPVYRGEEVDHHLVEAIRRGHTIFQHPDLFKLTQTGFDEIEDLL